MKRQEFSIKIASTGDTFIVPANKTILDILLENGIKPTIVMVSIIRVIQI